MRQLNSEQENENDLEVSYLKGQIVIPAFISDFYWIYGHELQILNCFK